MILSGTASSARAAPARSTPEEELEKLSRELHEKETPAAYARLRAFAKRRSSGELGLRAALALGYFDYTKGRYAEARVWLETASRDPLLGEYAEYWRAEAERAEGRYNDALTLLENLRQQFPESVMTEPALQSLAEAALAADQPARGLAALKNYPKTSLRSPLLFLQARLEEQQGLTEPAVADFWAVYYHSPLSPEAPEAGLKARALESVPGANYPAVPLTEQLSRAETLYLAHRWSEAQQAYEGLVPHPTATNLDLSQLRIAECRVEQGADPEVLARLTLPEVGLDAERLYAIADAYRTGGQESAMLTAIEQAVARDPTGPWAEQALYAGGNYYWVNLDFKRAAEFYRRLLEKFPARKSALVADWRLAWVAYLLHQPEALSAFEEHLRRFPDSPYTVDALYWVGRAAERAGNSPEARAFDQKAADRFPQTYFGRLAAQRLEMIQPAPATSADVLSLIPAVPPLPELSGEIPPAAGPRWERAQALRSIAFDASAELELRAAYAATGTPKLLVEEARAAVDAEHYSLAAGLIRQIFPQMEARPFDDVALDIWRLVYPLPFSKEIKEAAKRAHLDPMLVAGVIRQESSFQTDAVSHAGAVGLMQLLPKTARKLARHLHVRYSRQRLFEPEYNLRLGAVYLAGLIKMMGGLEPALAAYNAGEDRVTIWQASRTFDGPAEFVESIPFTETREYVEIVSRNEEIYRHLYGRIQ